jgi:hypothetical protein
MATPKPHVEREQITPTPLIGRDELNLAEFPMASLADYAPKGQKTLYFEDEHGRLTVTSSDKYGLPTAADTDVIVALVYLTKLRNNFSDVKVNFSKYELINLIGWRDEGDSYKRLDLSFNRWIGVSLIYDGCWWNNRLKTYTDAKMHIIESVEIINSEVRRKARLAGQSELPFSCFTWNSKFIESCQADNLRQLDLDEYFSLKSAVSKRLYRFLGKRFYVQRDWTFDLHEIAFDRVGLSRSYADAYKIKEKLQPAIDELEAIGFLRPLGRDDRYRRIDRGQWTIRLTRQSRAFVAPQQATLPQAEPESPPLAAELVSRGVTAKTAADLVRKYPAEAIQLKIDVFDWLMDRQDRRVAKSPEGYLVKSICDGYKTPKGFVSKAELQRQAEAKRQKELDAAEARRREKEQAAREKAEKKAIIAYYEALTPEQKAAHDTAAIAQADAEERKLIEPGPMKRIGMGILRDKHTRQLLRDQGKLPPAWA